MEKYNRNKPKNRNNSKKSSTKKIFSKKNGLRRLSRNEIKSNLLFSG